jgi:uncharacterized protein
MSRSGSGGGSTMQMIDSPAVLPSENERLWAVSAHALALVLALATSWVVGAAGIVGGLVVFLIKRDDSAFATAHAREAMNFNLSMFIYACAAIAIGVVLIGATVLTLGLGLILTVPAGIALAIAVAAIGVLWLVCSIIATIKAWQGEHYRYPITLRLI